MDPNNFASEKIAIKNNYKKEGLLKSIIKNRDNKWHDTWIYSKINPNKKAQGLK
jgi:RimJ/RimL family protein N-acetyltransferase